jgi:hypothetical protein
MQYTMSAVYQIGQTPSAEMKFYVFLIPDEILYFADEGSRKIWRWLSGTKTIAETEAAITADTTNSPGWLWGTYSKNRTMICFPIANSAGLTGWQAVNFGPTDQQRQALTSMLQKRVIPSKITGNSLEAIQRAIHNHMIGVPGPSWQPLLGNSVTVRRSPAGPVPGPDNAPCDTVLRNNLSFVNWDLAPMYFRRAMKDVAASWSQDQDEEYTKYKMENK